jgi:hypothetical protein
LAARGTASFTEDFAGNEKAIVAIRAVGDDDPRVLALTVTGRQFNKSGEPWIDGSIVAIWTPPVTASYTITVKNLSDMHPQRYRLLVNHHQ